MFGKRLRNGELQGRVVDGARHLLSAPNIFPLPPNRAGVSTERQVSRGRSRRSL